MTEYYLPAKYQYLCKYGDKIASERVLCDININELHDDMYNRLQKCNWGKKVNKKCYLSFTISVIKKSANLTLLTIDIFMDDKSEIKNIIKTISSNTESILNTECGLIQRIKPTSSVQRIKPTLSNSP